MSPRLLMRKKIEWYFFPIVFNFLKMLTRVTIEVKDHRKKNFFLENPLCKIYNS